MPLKLPTPTYACKDKVSTLLKSYSVSVIRILDVKEGKKGKQCDCMEFTAYADKYSLCKESQPLIFSEI